MLAAGLVPAQDQPDPGAREQQEPSFESPSVLGRSDSLLTETKGALTSFGLYAQMIGVYDSGLTPVPTEQGSAVTAHPSYGVETSFGVNAAHRWRRAKLSIQYRGTYREYTNAPAFDGFDQFLQIAYSAALLEHLTLDLKSTLGSTTLANGAFSYLPLSDLDRSGIPVNELFDSRTNYLQSRVDLTWRKTERLSFSLGGDGFLVRRSSLVLAGLNGYSARASVAYRLTARQTISANYENTYFDFQNAFGDSRLETAALGYSVDLTREWDLSAQAGAIRVDTRGLTQVAIDPAIAAITGQNFATVTFTKVLYLPVTEFRLIRRFKTSSLTFDYSTTVTPGNGLYLTSRQTGGAAIYSYIANRNLQLRGNAGYGQLSALGQALEKYSNVQGGAQVLYRLAREAYVDVRYDYRHYTTGDAILEKDSNRVSLGLSFQLGQTSGVAW